MTPEFPLELIQVIISHLNHARDRSSLKSFSQTSSAFRDLCQSYLFYDIAFVDSESQSTAGEGVRSILQRFLDLLSSSPRIIPHVKEITISDMEASNVSWLSHPDGLKMVEILDKLDLEKIEGFELKRKPRRSWMLLDDPIRRVILELCRSPSLVVLSLWFVPLEIVRVCSTSVKHLMVHDCTVGSYVADIPTTRCFPELYLEHLRLVGRDMDITIDFLFDPSNGIGLDRLRTLQVTTRCVHDGPDSNLSNLLSCCQNSLENLTVGLMGENTFPELCRAQSLHFPRLIELHFAIDVTIPWAGEDRFTLTSAAEALSVLLDKSSMQTAHLLLVFDLAIVPGGLSGPSMEPSKEALNLIGAIVTRGNFPYFENLRVKINSEANPDEDDVKSIRGWVLDALNIPQDSKLLELLE
ncbi:hypothetical protein NMY22_g13700 [Coprinellus aureogranulatus]|nr:hypothetical protein NMY22_g13700 [Coprinellus aureogranulatus]